MTKPGTLHLSTVKSLDKCHFLPGGGGGGGRLPKVRGVRYFSEIRREDQKVFLIKKGGSLF